MWDRWVIVAMGMLIAGRSFQWGWQLKGGRDRMPALGAFLLGLLAIGTPLVLMFLGPASGR